MPAAPPPVRRGPPTLKARSGTGAGESYTDNAEDERFIDDDEVDAEAEYADE